MCVAGGHDELAEVGIAEQLSLQAVHHLVEGLDRITRIARTGVDHAVDRHDEVVQRVRSVRSERYRYIRNYIPERPFMFYHGHQRAMYPVISLLDRLNKEGKLNAVQGQLMAPRLPEEELYDLANDPHEIRNLAGSDNPEHWRVLHQLRGALDDWIDETGDRGMRDEPPELVQQWMKVMYDRWGYPPKQLKPPYVYGDPYWPLPE